MPAMLVLSTAPERRLAEKIAQSLVAEHLAASVNLLPQIDSRFWWEGKIGRGREVLLLIKTHSSKMRLLTRRIDQLHPYEIPEVLAIPIRAGLDAYLKWMAQSVRGSKGRAAPAETRTRRLLRQNR